MSKRGWSATSVAWLVAVVGLLCMGASCDSGAQPREDAAPSESPNGGGAGSSGDTKQNSELFETKGDPCVRDMDCSGYLRCLEETCRVPPAVTGEVGEETPAVVFYPGDAPEDGQAEPVADYYVEIADSAAERRRGLMYRREMDEDWGMLFIYPDEAPRSFWMKNTLIPLDMVYIAADGRLVSIVERAEPMSLQGRPSEGPARFVLELNGGEAAEAGLKPGMQMRVKHVPDSARPQR